MKKFIILLYVVIFMAFCVLLLTQCTGPKLVTSDTKDSTSVVQTITPDTTKVKPDSTQLHVELTCDSLNRVIIKMLNDKKTDGVVTSLNFNNGVLDYKTQRPEKTIILYPIQKTINHWHAYTKTDTIFITQMNLFQKIFFCIGLISLLIFIVMLYFKFK